MFGRRQTRYRRASFANKVYLSHRKDHEWRPAKRNPMVRREVGTSRLRLKIAMIAVISVFCATAAILLFHPSFFITRVTATGLDRVGQQEFTDAVMGMIEGRSWFVFPKKDYFVVDTHEIEQILVDRFPLASVAVTKEFPNALVVEAHEKLSTVIYDNGKQYVALDLDGVVVEPLKNVGESEWSQETAPAPESISTSTTSTPPALKVIRRWHTPSVDVVTAEFGRYPIMYDTRAQDVAKGAQAIEAQLVAGSIAWYEQLSALGITMRYIEISDGSGQGRVITAEGWEIRADISNRVDEQLSDLSRVLKEKNIFRAALKYIDVRYPGKVYWQ